MDRIITLIKYLPNGGQFNGEIVQCGYQPGILIMSGVLKLCIVVED